MGQSMTAIWPQKVQGYGVRWIWQELDGHWSIRLNYHPNPAPTISPVVPNIMEEEEDFLLFRRRHIDN